MASNDPDSSYSKLIIEAATQIAQNAASLILIRVLRDIAERAMNRPGGTVTAGDLLVISAELAARLDVEITKQIEARKGK